MIDAPLLVPCDRTLHVALRSESALKLPDSNFYAYSSRWTSIDRNNLDWWLEAFSKAFVRVGNLAEAREESYLLSKYHTDVWEDEVKRLESILSDIEEQMREVEGGLPHTYSLQGSRWEDEEAAIEDVLQPLKQRKNNIENQIRMAKRKVSPITPEDRKTLAEIERIHGRDFSSREAVVNIAPFLINRQQFSVLSTAMKFLHQGVGSLNFNVGGTLKKLKGLKMVSFLEVDYMFKMTYNFLIAMVLRLGDSLDLVRATNKEIYLHMPDLLVASASPHLNVSAFSTNTVLNINSFHRTTSEANNVLALVDQKRKIEKIRSDRPDLYWGMPYIEILELVKIL